MKTLELKTSLGDIEEVQFEIGTYRENGSIYIGLTSVGEEFAEPFGDVTVNLGGSAVDYCGYLDSGNLPELESFITDNGIGEYTGFSRRSGYNEYPFYIFNTKKLQELCPEGVARYEKSLEMDGKVEDKQIIR